MANVSDKSILTAAGKALLAQLNAEEKALVIDKMIFANVPNRPEYPQPDDVVPTDNVVHQAAVEQRGRLSEDSVIYSTTLASNEGPFEFNWTGAYCSEYGVLVTIDHHSLTPKTVDEPGVSGNTLVRSVVLEYKDIAEITNITVDASTWQYNATPRMKKMDNDVAQANIDQNGKDWFIEEGFLVTPQASAFSIKAGAGYVSGNRVALEFDRSIQVPNKPSFIYIDAHREGTPTGEQVTLFNFVVSAEEKDDYIDSSTGKDVPHFVCKIAQVLGDGSVSDLRPDGESAGKNWVKALPPSVFSTDWVVDTFQDMVKKEQLKVGESCRILGRKKVNDGGGAVYSIVQTGDSDGGNLVALDNGFYAERLLSVFVRTSEYGASEVDSSAEMNAAVQRNKRIQVDRLVSCKHVSLIDEAFIDVTEVLQLPDNSEDADLVISSDNIDRVKISGSGRISGNKQQQVGDKQQRLIRLLTNDSTISELELGENYSIETPDSSVHCVSMEGQRNRMATLRLSSWGQEGLVLKNNQYSMMHDIIANDEDSKSWSAAQVHGSHNMINGVIAKNTGASAVGCDSTHAVVTNIIVDLVRWHNGVNLGHTGNPASYSVASNLVITNLNDPDNANAAGLSLANGTRLVSVVNYSLKNPIESKANKGINVSNGGGEHQILNAVLDGVITAVNLYSSEYTAIGNLILKSCDYGIVKNDDAILQLMNADLSGATTALSGAGASNNVRAVNTIFDRNDACSGGVVLGSVSFPYRVYTKNVKEFSSLIIEPSNANGAKAMVYVPRRGDGYFELDVAGVVDGGAHIRWRIV
ncbi:phage tail-collar fiber domain-containing protein [Vibrio cyclitrophicus]